ncbi:hypothetical protein Q3G72_030625 [Acer saccharum]|nr:hypothetical protein Q3G72_030625 [Acer saccharum]
MGSHRRSFFTEPNSSTTTSTTKEYLGKSSNHAVSQVIEEENPMAQMWRTPRGEAWRIIFFQELPYHYLGIYGSKLPLEQVEGQYSAEAVFQAAELSLKCLESDPQSRPSMKEVVEALKEIEALNNKTK